MEEIGKDRGWRKCNGMEGIERKKLQGRREGKEEVRRNIGRKREYEGKGRR